LPGRRREGKHAELLEVVLTVLLLSALWRTPLRLRCSGIVRPNVAAAFSTWSRLV